MFIISNTTQGEAWRLVMACDNVAAAPLMVSSQPNSPATETMMKKVAVRNSVRAADWNSSTSVTSRYTTMATKMA